MHVYVPRYFHRSWFRLPSCWCRFSPLSATTYSGKAGLRAPREILALPPIFQRWNCRCAHLDFEVFQILKLGCLACTATAIPAEASPQLCSFFRTAWISFCYLPPSCLGLSCAKIIGVCHHFCLDDIFLLRQGLL